MTPEIQREAARSLLERFKQKAAVVKFFLYNSCAKHGVPPIDLEPVDLPEGEPQGSAPLSEPVRSTMSATTDAASSAAGQAPKWAKFALAAVLAANGLGASAYIGWALSSGEPQQPPAVNQHDWQSPFQYIEDQGGHLP